MSFRTFNQQGQKLLDSDEAVFSFVKSGRLTRLLDTPFEKNKRKYWYRAKRLGINSKLREGQADIHTPEYCMYYIDLPNAISPITGVYYDGLAKDCNPVVYLNTGYFDDMARMMFYSNGRLSDAELAKFHIYIFDVNVIKENKVGINLYGRQGNVTFSSRSMPMSLQTKTTRQSIPNNIKLLSSDEARLLTHHVTHSYDHGVDYYNNSTGSDRAMINKRKNHGVPLSRLLPARITKRCVGILSPKLSVGYYPNNSSELTDAIGDHDGHYSLEFSAGETYPHFMTPVVLACVGCVDGNHIKVVPPFDIINQDGTTRTMKQELTTRNLIFSDDEVNILFSDIDNLPFPFTRRPS
ncbi:hypothetical protein AAX05_01440 [Moraxella bovoculi]|uniref:Uncharacterized protein n=1 Tax=Moraxella bovoculi TaxID=386891 RepID=A0A0U2BEL0_9GAMM|nr:hypothetical protein [Moraxella bovoculi]AKG07074.1 hypothetical protein AAX06_01525 [Moraxella bovoculi]AKG09059.1 hypothetical protein AAX05_01440 [Moraxella bovoculi]AKG12178.1 hypothetical protein AAX07_09565 [Moraxella bovoculi]AKG12243.1 hypothetical protein AAX07_10025 [Moraxella bovoculi]AKG14147.1 hypothetical protein AAX11_09110 [Moraxella bovoculi]